MKTYRIEDWDLLLCPEGEHSHVGGKIYGHPLYEDGTYVMSDAVAYFDADLMQAQTRTTGLLQLGEPSECMKKKMRELPDLTEKDGFTDAAGNKFTSPLGDQFQKYTPNDWSPVTGQHEGIQEARDALNDLLKQVFGKPGAPDKKRQH